MLDTEKKSSDSCGVGLTPALAGFNEWKDCESCGDDVHIERWALGYRVCKGCGEAMAREERASWCVVMEYGKGHYSFVTADAARRTLLDTNQKNTRS